MSTSRYVRIRGHVSGPFSEDKLVALVKRGQLTRSHEVSEDGVTWSAAGELESLFSRPKMSGGADTSQAQSTAMETPKPPEAATASTSTDRENWFFAVKGRRSEPVGWLELQDRVIKGKVPLDALVWSEGMDDWQVASSIPGLLPASSSTSKGLAGEMTWGDLVPLFRLWNDGGWALPWVQCLAIAVLFPLLALEYQGKEQLPLVWVAIVFLFYFSLLWTAFFHWCISPGPIGPWRIIGVWLFTATLGMVGIAVASEFALPFFIDAMEENSSASLFKRIVGWTVAVGFVEELGKLAAVLLLTKNLVTDRLPRTCAFMGVVSGLSFGTIEAAFYTYRYVLEHQQSSEIPEEAYGMLVFLLMLRWICLPLLHAIWAGISGFFVGLSYQAKDRRWQFVLRGVLIAAVLHGFYDVGAADSDYSWLTVVSAAVSLSLLIGYLRSEVRMSALVMSRRTGVVAS